MHTLAAAGYLYPFLTFVTPVDFVPTNGTTDWAVRGKMSVELRHCECLPTRLDSESVEMPVCESL